MAFDYWTVRLLPGVFAITTFGVGVIVADPRTGEAKSTFRDVRPLLHAHQNRDALVGQLSAFIEEVQQESKDRPRFPKYLDGVAENRMNEVRVEARKTIAAESIESALSLLYSTLVCGDGLTAEAGL